MTLHTPHPTALSRTPQAALTPHLPSSIVYPDDCLALLQSMEGQAWTKYQVQRFLVALERMPPDLGRAVLDEIGLEKWRPAPRDLLRRAAAILSPCPDVEIAFGELMQTVAYVGYCNTPCFSHPVLQRAVFSLGGWSYLCAGEAGQGSTFKAQFRESYKLGQEVWNECVVENILRPNTFDYPEILTHDTQGVPVWQSYPLLRTEREVIAYVRSTLRKPERLPQKGGVIPDLTTEIRSLLADLRSQLGAKP